MAKPGKCAESGFPSPEDFDKACFGGGGGGAGGRGGQELRHSYKQDTRMFLNPFLSETLQCKHNPPVPRDTRCLPQDKSCS